MPKVSIVIRAKNEERHIGETLAAIQRQRYRNFEIVVVDSGSTDRTLDIVQQYPTRLIQIEPKQFTYGYALNLGVRQSQGEVAVALSAHSTPVSDRWLSSLVAGFQNPEVAGVYGRQIPRENVSYFEEKGMYWCGVTSSEPRVHTSTVWFSNANGAFRRNLWEMIPFDEKVPGAEDIDWVQKVQSWGYVILFEPHAAVYHSHGSSIRSLIKTQILFQPVIARAWMRRLLAIQPVIDGARVRGREIGAK